MIVDCRVDCRRAVLSWLFSALSSVRSRAVHRHMLKLLRHIFFMIDNEDRDLQVRHSF